MSIFSLWFFMKIIVLTRFIIKLSDEREAEGFPRAEAVGFVTKLYDHEPGRFWMYVCVYVCMSSVYPHLLIHYLTDRNETYTNR